MKRHLAFILDDNTIQLRFETKGPGHKGDDFYLNQKLNQCVVCGKTEFLTKHHIVPYCYRKHLPENIKSHASYDVVILCMDCHHEYEKNAFNLKKQICAEAGISVAGVGDVLNFEVVQAMKAMNALTSNHVIPQERRQVLNDTVFCYYKRDLSLEEQQAELKVLFRKRKRKEYKTSGQHIVENLTDVEEFVKRWRTHFIETMQPRHLPDGWTIHRTIYRLH